jgi:hypothetical protein
MDFFDPEKQKRHTIRLYVGYALIGLALVLITTILLYQAYGYGVDRKGNVIQNGLVFLSSQPEGGKIYLDGERYKADTNTRMTLLAGQHKLRIERDGYHTWQRALTVEGGSVERFDYPILYPTRLSTTTTKQYPTAPGLVSQSPDRRWVLVGTPASNTFDLYDFRSDKPVPKTVAIPEDILAAGATTGWQETHWADDNRHAILLRTYQKDTTTATEYILFDRSDPAKSQNLSQVLGFTPSQLELREGDYDRYYAFDQANGTVFTAELEKPTPQLYLEQVLNFTVDEETALYATTKDVPANKVQIRLKKGSEVARILRTVPAKTQYLLDLAVYDGNEYVAAGAQSEGKVYVYQEPLADLTRNPPTVPTPVQILKVDTPSHVAFSPNARFVMAENADRFSVYDAETDRGYTYQVKATLDEPQKHAAWVDGYHMTVVTKGRVHIFDYDGANARTLNAASPLYEQLFTPNYRTLYTVTAQNALTATSLLTLQDR